MPLFYCFCHLNPFCPARVLAVVVVAAAAAAAVVVVVLVHVVVVVATAAAAIVAVNAAAVSVVLLQCLPLSLMFANLVSYKMLSLLLYTVAAHLNTVV